MILDVEAMERATVEAVAPPEVLEIGGWLVPLDATTVGRAKSAVPHRGLNREVQLRHGDLEVVAHRCV